MKATLYLILLIGATSINSLAEAPTNKEMRTLAEKELDAPLLFIKRHPYMSVHIYDEYLTWHPGGGIYVIENPAAPIEEQIVRPIIDETTPETLGRGVYRDPELSYEATKLLFAFKGEEHSHTSIYEIRIDGTGLRRITDPGKDTALKNNPKGLLGEGQHDVTPCYLPDGRIAFTSTRSGGLVMCFNSYIDTLHTMNSDGSNIQCISVNNQNEFDPVVLADGRILYGRWEYVDKSALYMQSLWTVNPDGSHETSVFGNNLAKPTALLDARPVPNSDLIATALTPHNGQSVGAIAMLDPKIGKNDLRALTNFTPEFPTNMGQGYKYGPSDPWPLNEDVILIANNDRKHGKHGVIELISRDGGRMIVRRETDISCYSPMLIKSRPKPPARPSMIRDGEPGRFLVHDIYQGMDGVERGSVKWLRVLETTSRVSATNIPKRYWNQAFLVSWQGSYDVKRFLGVVPVEEDGSAYFEAPPGKALYFQALDKDRRLIQSQRTFVQAVAGITRSCMGCHIEDDNLAPSHQKQNVIALTKPPSQLKLESWGHEYVDYPSMVQPVLDKHCVSCHGGEEGVADGIDLSGGWTTAFNISYETLIKNQLVGFLRCQNNDEKATEILPPYTHGSGAAPLADLILDGHEGRIKNMTQAEKNLILAWIDGNCNYYGTWDYAQSGISDLKKMQTQLKRAMETAGCVQCHKNEIGQDWYNLQYPEKSRMLRAPLTKESPLGLSWCRNRKAPDVDYALSKTKKNLPPDRFHPTEPRKLDLSGSPHVVFKDTNELNYQAILKIIQEARADVLSIPRIDMPGAIVTKGEYRELKPISAP